MKRCALGILAAALLAAASGPANAAAAATSAQDQIMSVLYGNTLLSMNQPMYLIRVWFYPDGTFKQFKASHESGSPRAAGWEGTYTFEGTPGNYKVCMSYNRTPARAAMPYPTPGCQPIVAHKMGDVWKLTYNDGPYKGTTETFTITEGHDTQP